MSIEEKTQDNSVKDESAFLDSILSAVANYSYECDDMDFEAVVKIECHNGWADAPMKLDYFSLPLCERLTEEEKAKVRDEFKAWEHFAGTKDDALAKGAMAALVEVFGAAFFEEGGEE